ncbi:hypothetical protein [Clostridium kluyveri]|uniref:LXG domain-containing protein n=1 Tax=Clostridium kluyveri TaxID=1534 RepID=A0A1L5FBB1_CLOKL|nr:hypothetical protein [Clostridium kluyveri]APM40253.1 hypothetical protein BS101_16680 [Clostridium kluyveri]
MLIPHFEEDGSVSNGSIRINKTIAELTEAGWSGEAKDKFMEKHIKNQEFYTNLIEDIKYVKNALENEEKPRAIRLKKQSEDFVNCIKRSGGGAALTNDDTGIISLQYGGQFQINNNVSECIDNYKKMNSKFEEILNLANGLSFTSFPIADDVLNLQNSLKNQTTSLTEFNDSFNEYCNGVRDMEENICSVFSKISGITVGISGITVGISEFRGISAISENGQVDKNKVIQLMLKNPNDLTNGEKELLSYVEKVLSKDEYAELKEQAIKEDNGQEIADNLKLKFGDTSIYGPLLELANNDGFLKSIKKSGEDFIIGAGNSLDKNIFWGTVFTVGGINQSSMPKSIPYKIGELAGDIGSFAFGAAEAGTGAGGELLGFTADGTVVLAPAGVALNAASLGLVTHGGAATIKSAHNFGEDLFSLIKGEGNKGASKAINPEWQSYFEDIEANTGRNLTHEQKNSVIEEIGKNPHNQKLTGQAYKDHRADFNNQKDDLILEWEQNTGQTWPTYENDVLSKNGNVYIKAGDKYDAHEIIPNVYNSPLEWWNLHPAARPGEHQGGVHGTDGAIKAIFK